MSNALKNTLKIAAAGSAAIAGAFGTCCFIDELLFNRKLKLPDDINRKIAGCNSVHLGDFLQNNLQWLEDYGYERHYIVSDSGFKLTGYLFKAKEESDVYLFGAHGYRSYGKKEFSGVAQYYLAKGINVFLPDHVASGESEGTRCTFSYHEVRDCLKWLDYLTENFGKDIKIILHGVSMGSATVMTMGGRQELPENVKAIVADCGFTTAKALFEYKLGAMGLNHNKALISGVDVAHKQIQGCSFDELCPIEYIKNVTLPVLFVHGAEDNLVPAFMAQELYDACPSENKDLLLVEGADHAQAYMFGKEDFEAKLDKILAFVM